MMLSKYGDYSIIIRFIIYIDIMSDHELYMSNSLEMPEVVKGLTVDTFRSIANQHGTLPGTPQNIEAYLSGEVENIMVQLPNGTNTQIAGSILQHIIGKAINNTQEFDDFILQGNRLQRSLVQCIEGRNGQDYIIRIRNKDNEGRAYVVERRNSVFPVTRFEIEGKPTLQVNMFKPVYQHLGDLVNKEIHIPNRDRILLGISRRYGVTAGILTAICCGSMLPQEIADKFSILAGENKSRYINVRRREVQSAIAQLDAALIISRGSNQQRKIAHRKSTHTKVMDLIQGNAVLMEDLSNNPDGNSIINRYTNSGLHKITPAVQFLGARELFLASAPSAFLESALERVAYGHFQADNIMTTIAHHLYLNVQRLGFTDEHDELPDIITKATPDNIDRALKLS